MRPVLKCQDVEGTIHETVRGSRVTKCGRRIPSPDMLATTDSSKTDCLGCIAAGDPLYRATISPSDIPNMQQIPRSKR